MNKKENIQATINTLAMVKLTPKQRDEMLNDLYYLLDDYFQEIAGYKLSNREQSQLDRLLK